MASKKIESLAEFMARGGAIKKVAPAVGIGLQLYEVRDLARRRAETEADRAEELKAAQALALNSADGQTQDAHEEMIHVRARG